MKKVKKETIMEVFAILNTAKYGRMSDDDKVRLWKITRTLKPVALNVQEDYNDARQRMKPTDDFDKRLKDAQQYERDTANGKPTAITKQEYDAFIVELLQYQEMVHKTAGEVGNEEVEIEFEPISEEAFEKLMASNDWTAGQTVTLGDFIMQ